MKTVDLSKFYGKPSGLSLATHTANVKRFGGYVRRQFPFLAIKYARLTNGNLEELAVLAEEYHDYGKAMPPWHEACKRDVALYFRWLDGQGIVPGDDDRQTHQRYEAATANGAPHLRRAGFRHEMGSVAWVRHWIREFPAESLAAIAAHHAKLSQKDYARARWRKDGDTLSAKYRALYDLPAAYEYFRQVSERTETQDWEAAVLQRYRHAAVRGLLQLADTRASRWEGMGDEGMVELHNFSRPRGFGVNAVLRPVQRAALDHAHRERTILRAPTGSGKTYAALLWATEQIVSDTPRADRLVIAMPTRFTSNALHRSVRDQLEHTGLFHSSAFHHLFGDEGDDSWGSLNVERQKLAKLLAFPTTVCTIDHLLASLTGSREEHHTTFFFLANSCVVFDETDFYDEFVQQNLAQLLEVLRLLQVPTLIMSATVPDSARELYGVVDPIVETAQPGSERVVKDMHWLGTGATAQDCAAVLDRMIAQGSGIVYANTVARALDYYDYLRQRAGEQVPVVIYHSRFTEPDKARVEHRLDAILGESAHAAGGGRGRGIAVLTQIGEMSINISTDLMLTDLCPWDRLAQRIGRLARFATAGASETRAQVFVCEPVRNNQEGVAEAFPAPYGNLVRGKGWELSPAYAATLRSIRATNSFPLRLTPSELVALTNAIYPDLATPSAKAGRNRETLISLMRKNWLLTGGQATSEDEGRVGGWSARDIPQQVIVLTEWTDRTHFTSFAALNAYALRHGVTVPQYKVEQDRNAERKGAERVLTERNFTVGRGERPEVATVYLAHRGAYDATVGLAALYGYPWTPETQL